MFIKSYKNKALTIITAVCILSLMIMILSLAVGKRQVQAEFTPPGFDANACAGTPKVAEELGWEELDLQTFKVSVCGVIIPSGNSADVWLTNHAGNDVWIKLRVFDVNGDILGETGLIKPGEYIRSVALSSVPSKGTDIVLKIMAYEPHTYYSAGAVSLNTTVS